jgi:hypothetical protein
MMLMYTSPPHLAAQTNLKQELGQKMSCSIRVQTELKQSELDKLSSSKAYLD